MPESSSVQNCTPWVLEIVQIGFYLVVAAVTWLTYKHARKTILQPFKTETFKVQIRLLERIQALIGASDESVLRNSVGLLELSLANAEKLLHDHDRFLGRSVPDESTTRYSIQKCRRTLINTASVHADDYAMGFLSPESAKPNVAELRRERPQDWSNYTWTEIRYPNEYSDKRQEITAIRNSVFIPRLISDAIRSFECALDRAESELQTTLTDCGRALNDNALEILQIHNTFNRRLPGDLLKRPAEELLRVAGEYAKSNEIMTDKSGIAHSKAMT